MRCNSFVCFSGKRYRAWVFVKNKIKADDMGEIFDCVAYIRIPAEKNKKIGVQLGDSVTINEEEFRVVSVCENSDGVNPHYSITAVR